MKSANIPPSIKVSVRFTDDDCAILCTLAERTGEPVHDLIRWAVRFYAMQAPDYVIPSFIRDELRDQFGFLPVGPDRWETSHTLPELSHEISKGERPSG